MQRRGRAARAGAAVVPRHRPDEIRDRHKKLKRVATEGKSPTDKNHRSPARRRSEFG